MHINTNKSPVKTKIRSTSNAKSKLRGAEKNFQFYI